LLGRLDRARQDRDEFISFSNECIQLAIDNECGLLRELQPVQRLANLLVGDSELMDEIRPALGPAGFLVIRPAASRRPHELSRDVLCRYLVGKSPT
jgi:hypothetical protein